MKWQEATNGYWNLWEHNGELIRWVLPDLCWWAAGGSAGQATTLDDGKAAVEAALWARAAERLAGR